MANKIEIVITADNRTGQAINGVNKSLGGLGKVAGGATGAIGSFGSALGGMAVVAGGIIAANIFGKIVSGVGAFVSTGLEAVGSAQQLETSLKALLTANNLYEQSTQQVAQAVVKQVMSQDELAIKSGELSAKLAVQRATFNEQSERIRQLTLKYGENGLAVIKARAQHDKLGLAIQKTERDIANLTTTETSYTTVTKTVFNQTMSQAEAFKIASQQTKELMKFVSQVAVISPFETETVEMTTKYAVAAGLGVEQTKQFVPAFLDLAAAVGISSNELGFAADQLFQVRKVGKLTEIDLRQLRRLGIDLGKIIGVEMGMSIEEFNAAAEQSPEIFDELFDAVTRFSQNTFAGTSKEMATSVKGLKSTLSDIFVIGARNFWEPLVDAVTPMVSDILGKLSDFVLGGDVASLGQKLAKTLMKGLSIGKALFNIAKVLGLGAAIKVAVQMIRNAWSDIWDALLVWADNFWNWITEVVVPNAQVWFSYLAKTTASFIVRGWSTVSKGLVKWGKSFWDWIAEVAIPGLSDAFDDVVQALRTAIDNTIQTIRSGGSPGQVVAAFLGGLGISPEMAGMAQEILDGLIGTISQFVTDNWPTVEAALFTWRDNFFNWVNELIIAAPEVLVGIIDAVSQFFVDNWPTIEENLLLWRDNFFNWVGGLYAQIPTVLGAIVTGITDFLGNPALQEMSAVLQTWTLRFWDWAQAAAVGAGAALGAILLAINAWVFGEGGAQLLDLGLAISDWIVIGIENFFANTDKIISVMSTIATVLAGAVVGIIATLGLIGGQIAAGIIQGLLNKLGELTGVGWLEDFRAATVAELTQILQNIGSNIATIATTVGTAITDGFKDGIFNGIVNVRRQIENLAVVVINAIKAEFGISSPSSVFFDIGVNLLHGLIDGLRSIDLGGILGEVFGGVAEFVAGLFGGGETEAGGFLAFDATAIIAGLQTVQVFLTETIPQGVATLMENFSLFLTMTTEQLTMLTTGPLTLLINTIASIYLIHTPTLSAAWMALTALVVAQVGVTIASVAQLIAALVETQNTATRMANKVVDGMKKAADSIKDKLIPAVKQATTAFRKLEEAARAAAAAARAAGSASKSGGGTRFQHGTPPGGFTVPPGFPNDSFLARFTSGERIFAFPRGEQPQGVGRQSNTTNNYYFNQTVNTRAESSTVIGDFKTMQLLLGT